jgi:hypothetical protein
MGGIAWRPKNARALPLRQHRGEACPSLWRLSGTINLFQMLGTLALVWLLFP